MKVFMFEPPGYGYETFIVAAESEQEARSLVQKKIETDFEGTGEHSCWLANQYTLTVALPGDVLTHENT